MGLLDSLLGRQSGDSQTKAAEDLLMTEELAKAVGSALGEELGSSRQGGHGGWMTKSQIVGVFAADLYGIEKMRQVSAEELKTFEDAVGNGQVRKKIGLLGLTKVDAAIYSKITAALAGQNIPFSRYVGKEGPMPMVLATVKGNIYIAPIIETTLKHGRD